MTLSSKKVFLACGIWIAAIAAVAAESDSTNPKAKLNVVSGPGKAKLLNIAEINVPAGYVFFDGESTRQLLKSKGEPTSGSELGLMVSTNDDFSVFFDFSDVGYVKDDDKDKLNPDKLLASIKRGNDRANEERVKGGNPALEIVGWEIPPRYDSATHNLEWAIRCSVSGRPLLNYNTRLLGRKGVMEVVLVVQPDRLQSTLPNYRNLLAGYSFSTGQTYAEYRAGDKVAKYGLAGLILAGATVGAAKLGLFTALLVFFKKAYKLVVLAVVALIASFKKLLARLFGGKKEPGPS